MMKQIALGVVALVTLASQGQAQRRERNDSEPKFSLFGGIAADGVNTGRDAGASNFELGGSADFRLRSFPLPLRASLTFSQQHRDFYLNDRRSGALSIDAVGHPIPSFFGIRPYMLGGLGVATQAEYGVISYFPNLPNAAYTPTGVVRFSRQNWAFLEGGMGLELGKHLFIQSKLQLPVASQGATRTPVSIGIRF